jgi:hypothetical protein
MQGDALAGWARASRAQELLGAWLVHTQQGAGNWYCEVLPVQLDSRPPHPKWMDRTPYSIRMRDGVETGHSGQCPVRPSSRIINS